MIEVLQSEVGNAEGKPQSSLKIAHVLFMDVVGYSKLLVNKQRELIEELSQTVRATDQFRKSEAAGKLIRIPSGDGMALVFFESPEEPVRCALEVAQALREHADIRLRMGIHSGPVGQVKDVNDQWNVAGVGINIAERVMSCGDAGHILVTKRVGEDLAQSSEWRPYLHSLGEVELKHGVKIGIVNFCAKELGNRQLPEKVKLARQNRVREKSAFFRPRFPWVNREGRQSGRNLEDYDFYPFAINRNNIPEFSLRDFRLGMHYFLKNYNCTAARQLIFIGEQNGVRSQLEPSEQKEYEKLFDKYDGRKIADDTSEFLENYARIVRLIGKSFPDTGVEILLHNLADPAHSLVVLENNVTGRNLHAGATNLLVDLKKRQLFDEEKLNYELNIGARKFKCTTIPIVRKEFGIVGAICINVDVNYLTGEVMSSKERIEAFFKSLCRTEMQLDENILSKDEYAKALKGKRHFKDEKW
jgi:predicted transcriptional regulator YheO/class 3 adenylate cyclase